MVGESGGKLNSKLSRDAGARGSDGGIPGETPDSGAAVVAEDRFCAVNFSGSSRPVETVAFGATFSAGTAGLRGGPSCHAAIAASSTDPAASKGMTKLRLLR